MQRREFIALGGAAAPILWPLAVRAQQPAMPVVGYLNSASPEQTTGSAAAFRKGLSEAGYVEGRNVTIEYRWARNDYDRLPELAAELVGRRVAVIAAMNATATALAAKAATTTIPIVFSNGSDPVQIGLVASLNRPGGNVTGVTGMRVEIGAKRLGLLHELLPRAARFAVLVNPNNSSAAVQASDMQAAASAIGREIEIFTAATNRDIDTAFATLVQKGHDALLVSSDGFFVDRRVQIVTLAAHHRRPTIYGLREEAEAGGLMSYGANVFDQHRQAGIYAGRILKGEKPADLPVMRATRLEFIINLQTARTLSIEVPPTLFAIADEVIE